MNAIKMTLLRELGRCRDDAAMMVKPRECIMLIDESRHVPIHAAASASTDGGNAMLIEHVIADTRTMPTRRDNDTHVYTLGGKQSFGWSMRVYCSTSKVFGAFVRSTGDRL